MAFVVVLLAALVGCAEEAVLPWRDDFSGRDTGWQTASDASSEVGYDGGVMSVLVRWPDKLSWAAAGRDFADLRIRVDASQISGPDDNEYGILARMQDGEHFYMFAISGDGFFRIVKRDGSDETVLTRDWAASDAIHTGIATNQLDVTCRGSELTFAVNGAPLARVRDDAYSHGDVALYAGTFREPGDGVEIHFDNVLVTAPDAE